MSIASRPTRKPTGTSKSASPVEWLLLRWDATPICERFSVSRKRWFVGQLQQVSFSEGDCTTLLAQAATVRMSPDLFLSVAAFTIIVYAGYSYAQK